MGNPGRNYEKTRHNVGFEVIRRLAQRHAAGAGQGGGAASKRKFDGELQEALIGGERTLLLMPQTFMNLSGQSVRQAVDFYKIAQDEFLVICDDFQLPLGKIRLRAGGSDGGQKGLADTIRQLGSNAFSRLRFGIGPVPEGWEAADFVLGKFGKAEQKLLENELVRATIAVETWVERGIAVAMNIHNADPLRD